MERLKQFYPEKGFGVTGAPLYEIAEACAEVYGDKEIRINLPYHDFNCRGKATSIAKEVRDLTPFIGKKWRADEATTNLYYGDTPVDRYDFLPFQGDCEVFFIGNIEGCEINLVKAPNWRMYL